jgi:3-oxoacyl-[acyl-carrier protein] reductase
MKDISTASVLITGGGSGIGAAIAGHFAAAGARVTISGRRLEKLRAVADGIGANCLAVQGDVVRPEDRAAMVDAAVDHGGRLDVLVNAAGNMYRGAIDELDEAALLDLFHSNVVGPMMLTGAALGELRKSAGSVIVFGSVHTQRAFPGASPYAATKGALEALCGVLAAELGPQGVRFNGIRPGAVPTEINQRAGLGTDEESLARLNSLAPAHALGRIGSGSDIAQAAEYLALADWVTGTVLTVDGGLSLGVTNA